MRWLDCIRLGNAKSIQADGMVSTGDSRKEIGDLSTWVLEMSLLASTAQWQDNILGVRYQGSVTGYFGVRCRTRTDR